MGGAACADCFEGTSLSWTWSSASDVGFVHASHLAACNSYAHLFNLPGADDPLGAPQCTASVDGCPSRDLAALNATVQDPAVQAALQAHSVFGRDSREVDGRVRQITVGNDSFFVGAPCVGEDSACIAIPAVISTLVTQLQALDVLELSKASCASVFPDGSSF